MTGGTQAVGRPQGAPTGRRLVLGVALLEAVALGALAGADVRWRTVGLVGVAIVLIPVAVQTMRLVEPHWLLSGAVLLSMFSGNWRHIGLPNLASPDRLLLVAGVGSFLLRDPALGERRRLTFGFTHLVMLVAALFAIGSAIAVGTITHRTALYVLIDRFGLLPFVLFTLAPAVFATRRQRMVLLGTLVAIGTYLGITAIGEGLAIRPIVWPRYILDPHFGYQYGRARGPFANAPVDGLALIYCACACGVAAAVWRSVRWRRFAVLVAIVDVFTTIFTLQRSVWVGAVAGVLLVFATTPRLRRLLPGTMLVGALAVIGALLLVPGLQGRVTNRINDQQTVWDRKNLNGAAERMFEARPLAGFGWGQFQAKSQDYFQQSPDFPITNPTGEVHNVFLSELAELGLIGTALWTFALLLGVGGSMMRRGPPELMAWRAGLVGVAVMWFVQSSLTPLSDAFPNHLLWLWAGILWRPGTLVAPIQPNPE